MTSNCPNNQLPPSPLVTKDKNKDEVKAKYHNSYKHCILAMVEWLNFLGDNKWFLFWDCWADVHVITPSAEREISRRERERELMLSPTSKIATCTHLYRRTACWTETALMRGGRRGIVSARYGRRSRKHVLLGGTNNSEHENTEHPEMWDSCGQKTRKSSKGSGGKAADRRDYCTHSLMWATLLYKHFPNTWLHCESGAVAALEAQSSHSFQNPLLPVSHGAHTHIFFFWFFFFLRFRHSHLQKVQHPTMKGVWRWVFLWVFFLT